MTASSGKLSRGIKEGAAIAGGLLFALGTGGLYQKLTELHVGADIFTYSLSYTILVVLCAAGAYLAAALQIRRILLCRAVPQEPEEEMPTPEEAHYVSENPSDEIDDRYALPEEKEALDPAADAAVQRAEKIAAALAAQRGEGADPGVQEKEPSDEEKLWDAFYKAPPSSDEDAVEDFYADLPGELPEGYSLPTQDWEEEEADPVWEEEPEEERPFQPLIWNFVPIACVLVLLVGVLWICTSCWTGAGENGICVSRVGGVRQYSWNQVASYTVDAALSSGELQLHFQMKDGSRVKLSPASYAQTEAFADQYENLYQYWLHVDNTLGALGIEKTVTQREYLADTYRSREDGSWQYVQQLIGYMEDPAVLP